MERLSKIISIAFHPIFALFSGIIVACYVPSEPLLTRSDSLFWQSAENKQQLLILFGTFTIIFPITSLLTLYSTRAISSLEIPDRKERFLPALLVMIIHGVLYYFIRKSALPPILMYSLIGVILTFIIYILINLFYKISLHGIGAGLIFGFVFGYNRLQSEFSFIPLLIITFLIGIVGWARIKDEAHSLGQYFSGVALGMAMQILSITFEFKI